MRTQKTALAGENGLVVPIRNILAVTAVNLDGPDGGDALRRWYVNRGFMERGRLEKIGFKHGECLDIKFDFPD
jgi:phosphinothricin acetyltransferase